MGARRRGEPSAGRLFTFFRREIAQFAGDQTAVTRVNASHPLAHHAVLIMETKFSHVHEWRHHCRARAERSVGDSEYVRNKNQK